MLETGTYKKLKRKIQPKPKKIRYNSLLKDLERTGELRTKLYNKVRPSGSKPPMIYGLPKIHKPDVPLYGL